jgi:hypothetical protein
VKTALKEHPKALYVVDQGQAHHELPTPYQKRLATSWEYSRVKQGTPGALPAIVVAGEKVGAVVYVKKGAHGSSSSSTRSSTSAPKEKSPKERLGEFMKRRTRKAIGLLVAKLGGNPDESPHSAIRRDPKPQAGDVKYPNLTQLVCLAMSLGIDGEGLTGGGAWKPFERFMQGGAEGRDRALWDKVRAQLIPALLFDAEIRADATGAKIVAACCGLSWQALVDAARDALPLPKTLAAHFDQDGRPLKALLAKPKAAACPPGKRKTPSKPTTARAAAKA